MARIKSYQYKPRTPDIAKDIKGILHTNANSSFNLVFWAVMERRISKPDLGKGGGENPVLGAGGAAKLDTWRGGSRDFEACTGSFLTPPLPSGQVKSCLTPP